MRYGACGALVVVCSLLAIVPALAHHSLQAQFSTNKSLDLTGTLTKIEWINPHSYLWLDVKDQKGTVKKWGLEMGSSSIRRHPGISQLLKVGRTYTAHTFPSKDGSAMAFLKSISAPGGPTVSVWFGDPNPR